ncbi:extracellular solute-binding protein [Alicyclobacillus curvatus]|nr:extracellular solute-binding protein [Alicyclobacillus curvatus]
MRWNVNKSAAKVSMAVITGTMLVTVTACGSTGSNGNQGSSNQQSNSGSSNSSGQTSTAPENLVIYTARNSTVINAVIPQFEKEYPNIKVQALNLPPQQILQRVQNEKANPQADFWWGGTQAQFQTAANEGLLQSESPSFASQIPANYKDSQGRWFGEVLFPAVIAYNSSAISASQVPQDWSDLIKPQYKGKLIFSDVMSSGTLRTVFSAMIYQNGASTPQKGYAFLKSLDANTKEYAISPTDLYIKMARQEGVITVWDLPDVLVQKYQKNMPFNFVVPKSGSPTVVDCVGVIKGAKDQKAAETFMNFLYSPSEVAFLAKNEYELPTIQGTLQNMPSWYNGLNLHAMNLDWNVIDSNQQTWMNYWDQNIKGKGNS